ncbi:MAG: tRNA (adenosine(37)-N6)-threonylcarbamoyltransferase complex dimerization subunit type 1 TsaB [Desulfatitalea sp.]|nr:tRNA (adenosine(37)-N6)-threonylcarbamoyltransferase complex dimerization subunit type 1 TsaB [Desulfatitalea sp.]NNJ99020.1 tRNA (adenosine(37)-N6)-threonylcarbamoyltransferase complex dimerization subunit type 1 TsaB [Desulfatitalea sp.]
MRLLAVDTATEVCGVALTDAGQPLAQRIVDQGLTHARVLMTTIHAVINDAGLALDALDGFVVTRGPGSFTGLRIGISTVKGLSLATGKPFIGVSTLAVLAQQASGDAPYICPMIDARRREVYWSLYRCRASNLSAVSAEHAGSLTEVLGTVPGACLYIGSGARQYRSTIESDSRYPVLFPDAGRDALQPVVVAQLGAQRLQNGCKEDLERFTPVYLRKSDAELARLT